MDRAQALPYLLKAADFDTTGGAQSVDEVLARSLCQGVECDGVTVGAYALELVEHQASKVLWVTACAADLPGQDLTPHLLDMIEQQAGQVGAAQVAMTTIRRGLVKKLLSHGYEITGITLRKKL